MEPSVGRGSPESLLTPCREAGHLFDRPTGTGPIVNFTMVPQFLLAGDLPWPA